MPTKCIFEENGIKCPKEASYGPVGTTTRTYCKTHTKEGMIITRKDKRACIHPDHKENAPRASFNYPNELRPLYCKAHSEEGMININCKNNMCKKCNEKQPSYGFEGQKATHCSSCAVEGMIDVISKRCKHKDCRKNVTYGEIGGKPEYCKKHALYGMIDVKNNKCICCNKQATYGIDKPTHCKVHKTNDMYDKRHSTEKCQMCDKRATYSIDTYPPTHCSNHKTEDMKDIISSMCIKCNETQGVFGYNVKELFCVNCKEEGMTNVKAKLCEQCNQHQPTYNYKNIKPPRFCNGCKLDGMVDIMNPMCTSCELFVVPKKPHLCLYCKPESTLRYKTKEFLVVNYLEENGINFIHNKSVGFVCGNYRPDILIDAHTHFVIVEIDEDQHKNYDGKCELVRMLNIHQAQGMRCIFIRYNPDVFRVKNKTKKVHTSARLDILLTEIQNHIKYFPEDEVTIYRLFYNNDDGEYVKRYDIDREIHTKDSISVHPHPPAELVL